MDAEPRDLEERSPFRRIASRVEKVVSPGDVNVSELVGKSRTCYKVEQTTKSKKRGDALNLKTVTISAKDERWMLRVGTSNDDRTITDSLSYSRTKNGQVVDVGYQDYGGNERNYRNRINVDVIEKFNALLRDLETPQTSSTTTAS